MDIVSKIQHEDVGSNKPATYKLGGITGRGFMPGQSGNPNGRAKKKPITELFEKLLDDTQNMEVVAASIMETLRSKGMAKVLMLREMAERVEGKVTQPVEISGDLALLTEAELQARLAKLEGTDGQGELNRADQDTGRVIEAAAIAEDTKLLPGNGSAGTGEVPQAS